MDSRNRKPGDGRRALKQRYVTVHHIQITESSDSGDSANKQGRWQAIKKENYLQMTGREVRVKAVSSARQAPSCSLSFPGLPALHVCSSAFVCYQLPSLPMDSGHYSLRWQQKSPLLTETHFSPVWIYCCCNAQLGRYRDHCSYDRGPKPLQKSPGCTLPSPTENQSPKEELFPWLWGLAVSAQQLDSNRGTRYLPHF